MPYNYKTTGFVESDFYNLDGFTVNAGVWSYTWELIEGGDSNPGVARYSVFGSVGTDTPVTVRRDAPLHLTGSTTTAISLVKIPVLSTAADEIAVQVGILSLSDVADGIFFVYDRLNLGANWYVRTRNGGSTTTTDTGIAVSTGWVGLQTISTPTSVTFWVDGAQVATHTTNIPTVGYQACRTTQVAYTSEEKYVHLDYASIKQDLATPRA